MKKGVFKEIDALRDEINSYRPLSPELVKQLKEYYKIGLTYSSNALEGNTLTESETKIVLEEGITIGGKPLKDHLEAIGHAEAYDFLYTLVNNKTVRENDIQQLHQLF
jgi:Fic family protein